jgi:hypothetical protein
MAREARVTEVTRPPHEGDPGDRLRSPGYTGRQTFAAFAAFLAFLASNIFRIV